jgi:hypothetical protein
VEAGAATVAGAIFRMVMVGDVTATVPVTVLPFAVAVTVTDVLVRTGIEVRLNVVVVAPLATVAVAGTVPTEVLDEDRLIV